MNINLIILYAFSLVIIIYLCYLTVKINSITKKSSENNNKPSSEKSIISILEEIQESSEKVLKKADDFSGSLEKTEDKISLCIQKVGLSRLEPFTSEGKSEEMAVALLNSYGDGIVISINKNNFKIKALEKGQFPGKLSSEEEKAIDSALK